MAISLRGQLRAAGGTSVGDAPAPGKDVSDRDRPPHRRPDERRSPPGTAGSRPRAAGGPRPHLGHRGQGSRSRGGPARPGQRARHRRRLFAGTAVPNGGRLSVGAKSPLTGGIKEANSGGSAARALARLGLRGVKVTGRGGRAQRARGQRGRRRARPAAELAGLGSFDDRRQAARRSTATRCRSSASARPASCR